MKNSDKPIANKAAKATQDRSATNFIPAEADAATELKSFFIDSLKDIYWAEQALVSNLPTMIENATSASLASTINEHLSITKVQVARLEKVFDLLGEKPEGKKCEAMAGLIKEGNDILKETTPGAVRDAGIIAASQKIEHYEIATYGTLTAFAKTLGENDAAKLLTQTLAEEKEADCLLNEVALNAVNIVAAE
jgi:ferritin-like metal-binding protein YciE